ncbi:amino acid adenylation domain-containing protein [Actinokineospora iranica]|uniref:Amino acid adenylation domain-containing protein n=1 Tax=Actinokineospora iranica TaxID=1271860 RepID=A0A1G6W8I6_9PSEU|nr:amino acid adenylation domain-containing protein [Actinokineospora iranica]SDD62124.1 amino acid adenylation domain-containing protein [Actinokineospora iranica]
MPPRPLHHWFLDGARANPDGVALRINSTLWTYTELDALARTWAGALVRHGGCKRVGVLAAKSLESYVGFLATLYAGAAFVPLNPEFPAERNRAVLAAADVDALIVDPAGAAQLDQLGDLPLVLAGEQVPGGVVPDSRDAVVSLPDGSPDELAYILFTSGSTGVPKGVPIRHRNIGAFVEVCLGRYDVGPADVFSQVYELTFDLSMFEVWVAWASGACLTVLNRLQALNPLRYVRSHGITVWTSTPSLVGALRTRGALPAGSMPGLRHTVFCGEPLPVESAAYWQAAAPNAVVDNLYGPTELAVACTGHRYAGATTEGTVPIGEVFPGMRCALLDEDGAVDPRVGELCFTGPQMFGGYLDPANDVGKFVELDGETWYRTGDRARLTDDVGLVHLGRNDNQVKVQGYRIELGDIESAVRAAGPGLDGVAFAVDGTLVAFVTGPASTDLAAVAKRLATVLPGYMLPKHLWRTEPVLTGNGKADRLALRAEAARRLGLSLS